MEHNHELLLLVKNLQELGATPFPYIVHVLPRSLPTELVRGKHFVLTDLLKLIPGSSSQEESSPEPLILSDFLPLSMQDPKPTQLPSAKRDSKLAPGWRRRRK